MVFSTRKKKYFRNICQDQRGYIGYFLVLLAGAVLLLLFMIIVQVLPQAAPDYDRFSFFRQRIEQERPSQARETTPETIFPTPITACSYYDFNLDNKVDKQDAQIVQRHLGQDITSANWDPKFDLNRDKKIDLTDMTIAQTLSESNLSC